MTSYDHGWWRARLARCSGAARKMKVAGGRTQRWCRHHWMATSSVPRLAMA